MKATHKGEMWMNATVDRIVAEMDLSGPRRTTVEKELRSQLFSAAEVEAGRQGRNLVDVAELEAAHAASGGDQGLRRAFAAPPQPPDAISSRRVWISATAFTLLPILIAVIAAAIALATYFGKALPGQTVIMVIAGVVSVGAASMTVGALIHILVRRDLARSQRVAWAAALVALSVAAAAVYFTLGRQGSRRFADWMVNRFRSPDA